ncbi:Glutamate decarboxylase [Linum perenne]
MENCHGNTKVLKLGLEKTVRFEIVSKEIKVLLVAFLLKANNRHTKFEFEDLLRRFMWIVSAYMMPADAQHITVLRVVVREDFLRGLAERLVQDITYDQNR